MAKKGASLLDWLVEGIEIMSSQQSRKGLEAHTFDGSVRVGLTSSHGDRSLISE